MKDRLTFEQENYILDEIISLLSYYGIDNPFDRKECAKDILNEVNYAIENK